MGNNSFIQGFVQIEKNTKVQPTGTFSTGKRLAYNSLKSNK